MKSLGIAALLLSAAVASAQTTHTTTITGTPNGYGIPNPTGYCAWTVTDTYAATPVYPASKGTPLKNCGFLDVDFTDSSIPANATVTGIQLVLGAETLQAGLTVPVYVFLQQYGGFASSGKQFIATATGTEFTLGGPTDTWGSNLGPGGFAVRFDVQSSNEAATGVNGFALALGGDVVLTVTYTTPQ